MWSHPRAPRGRLLVSDCRSHAGRPAPWRHTATVKLARKAYTPDVLIQLWWLVAHSHLSLLDLAGTISNMRHHVIIAGYTCSTFFTDDAIQCIF